MKLKKQCALESIDACKELLWSMSDAVWDHPETGYHEHFAAQLYCRTLEELGFQVELKPLSLAPMEAGGL